MPVQRRFTGSAARGMYRDDNGELARPPRQRQSACEASPITAREFDLAGNGLIQAPLSHLRNRAYLLELTPDHGLAALLRRRARWWNQRALA